jgi:tetratricopeptide (TPR) repeat protein
MIGRCLALCLCVWLSAAPTLAEERPDGATALAKKHNAEAEKLFNLGLFGEAAAAYQKAYLAKPVPELLYNLGQCYKRLGATADLEKAVFYYESFLNNVPATPLRPDVEDQIAKLKREIAARRAALTRPPPIYKRWWFWTLIGAAVTGAAVGTALALRPQDEKPVPGTIGEPSPLQLPLGVWR